MSTPWSVPPIWAGRTVAILASGPSMSGQVAEAVRGRAVAIAINTTFTLAPWAEMLYAADAAWWVVNSQKALKFEGLKVSARNHVPYRSVLMLRYTGREGFDPDPGAVRGLDSAYEAACVAIHAGASRILLCGVDLGGTNWHGRHPEPLRTTEAATFERMRATWTTLVPHAIERGVDLVNCSPTNEIAGVRRASVFDELRSP